MCVVCSLFWLMAYSRYTHFFHEWQTANALKEQLEVEAKEYPTLARNTISMQTKMQITREEIEGFISNRTDAAAIHEKRAKGAKRLENRYMFFWRWLGRLAQACFLGGFAFLIAFAAKNT